MSLRCKLGMHTPVYVGPAGPFKKYSIVRCERCGRYGYVQWTYLRSWIDWYSTVQESVSEYERDGP